MLKRGLEKCSEMGMERVLLTVDRENVASRAVILSVEGVLEDEVERDGSVIQRFWVTVPKEG